MLEISQILKGKEVLSLDPIDPNERLRLELKKRFGGNDWKLEGGLELNIIFWVFFFTLLLSIVVFTVLAIFPIKGSSLAWGILAAGCALFILLLMVGISYHYCWDCGCFLLVFRGDDQRGGEPNSGPLVGICPHCNSVKKICS